MAAYLADENFPVSIAHWLRSLGHDVFHAAERCPGASDDQILLMARDQRRVVLTFDRGFGDLLFRQGAAEVAGVVLFRLPQDSSELLLMLIRAFFEASPPLDGSFTVVTPGRYRQISLSRGT